ncbi:hypothetical protein AYI69_g3996, partial [Smittium culicis]
MASALFRSLPPFLSPEQLPLTIYCPIRR